MKAELQQQWRLLDLQKLDTRLDQIDHRLANMPQAKKLAELTKKADTATEEQILAQTAVMDVERELARSETDVQQVRDRGPGRVRPRRPRLSGVGDSGPNRRPEWLPARARHRPNPPRGASARRAGRGPPWPTRRDRCASSCWSVHW